MIWNLVMVLGLLILFLLLCFFIPLKLGRTDVNLDDKSIEITKLPSEREAYI